MYKRQLQGFAHGVVLMVGGKNLGVFALVLAAYHQYYAVGKDLQRTRTAVEGNGKIGVFWHTQRCV